MEIDYKVVKSNCIIQKVSYSLSATEQKLLLYIISKIKPTDEAFQLYSFRYVELLKVFGMDDIKDNRKIITDSCHRLTEKNIYFVDGDGDAHCHWCSYFWHNKSNIKIRIEQELKPYLLALTEQYTIYQLRQILTMKSRYSIRLYELCKSHLEQTYFSVEIDELKKMLASKYVWRDLRAKILDVAKEEINTKSDLLIDYTPIRTGRKYTAIRFKVIQKNRAEALRTQAREESKLYGYDK